MGRQSFFSEITGIFTSLLFSVRACLHTVCLAAHIENQIEDAWPTLRMRRRCAFERASSSRPGSQFIQIPRLPSLLIHNSRHRRRVVKSQHSGVAGFERLPETLCGVLQVGRSVGAAEEHRYRQRACRQIGMCPMHGERLCRRIRRQRAALQIGPRRRLRFTSAGVSIVPRWASDGL
jgi:hypothetical protein